MKQTTLLTNWNLQSAKTDLIFDPGAAYTAWKESTQPVYTTARTAQVQEILLDSGVITPNVLEDGHAEYMQWVWDTDWVYSTSFSGEPGKVRLEMEGLDTVCDVFLNGEYLGSNKSMYLPFHARLEDKLQEENELVIYFHRHSKILAHLEETMPEAWKGTIPAHVLLHKSSDYGAKDGFRPIGIFRDVQLVSLPETEIDWCDMETDFNLDCSHVDVTFTMEGPDFDGQVEAEFSLIPENGGEGLHFRAPVEHKDGSWQLSATLGLDDPQLWWPRNYGAQPLYMATYSLYLDGREIDRAEKLVGLRRIRTVGSMKFEVNGTVVRLWGADLSPIWGFTNVYNHEMASYLVEKAVEGNCNVTRLWGPGKPYPDKFYELFDRAGILVWQDFPVGGFQMPDTAEYKALYQAEAEHMVRRLKHHPCIYIWCGGNESIYMAEYNDSKTRIGFETLHYGFRDVCYRLDPKRPYHTSCPYEGMYSNDPAVGDSHGSRAFHAYIPGEDYGVFFSENIRTYPPEYKSFVRFMREDIWEDGYVDVKPFGCDAAMPSGWKKCLGNFGDRKLGPIHEYYSATNPQEMIYKYAQAASTDIYHILTKSRRGNPAFRSHEQRQSTGHIFWKLNEPWPNFYCAFIDYYGEPTMPYYAMKRAYTPVNVNFEVGDHVWIWGVNDTGKDWVGSLEFYLYDIDEDHLRTKFTQAVSIPAGDSLVLSNLDKIGWFHPESVLYARLVDSCGNPVSESWDYVTRENMIPFRRPTLTMTMEGDTLTLTTDTFARCVTLTAQCDGDEFGWNFEDNFFDLVPGVEKKVRVSGHPSGTICAKAQYGLETAEVTF